MRTALALVTIIAWASQAHADEPAAAKSSTSPWYADEWGWTLVTGGLITAALGTGFVLHGDALKDDARAGGHSEPESIRLNNEADAWRTAGGISLAVGGLVLASGVVKLVLHDRPAVRAGQASLEVGPGWLGVSGHF